MGKNCNDLELTNNQDKTWKQIKQMMGLKRRTATIPTLIAKKDGKTYKSTTTQEKIKTITETMENIFTKDDIKPYFDEEHKTKIETEINSTYKNKLKPQKIPKGIDTTKTEHSITKQEIETRIDKLNTRKQQEKIKLVTN